MFLSSDLCLVLEMLYYSFFTHFLRIVVNLFLHVLYLSSLCLDLDFRKYLYSKFFFLHAFLVDLSSMVYNVVCWLPYL